MIQLSRLCSILALTAGMSGSAFAHTGHGAAFGFSSGFLHPFGGLDHVLAMIAVGLLAAQLGGRALWLVPGTFVTVMVLAAAFRCPYRASIRHPVFDRRTCCRWRSHPHAGHFGHVVVNFSRSSRPRPLC
jgi:hypothetical protein